MLTTSQQGVTLIAVVVFAGTSIDSPDTDGSTVTFADGHAAGFADATGPNVADVNRTGYGFAFVTVNETSPSENPG